MKPFMRIAIVLTLTAFPAMALDATPTVVIEPTVPGGPQVVVETPATPAPSATYVVPEVVTTVPPVTYAAPEVVVVDPPVTYVVPEVVLPAPVVVETPAYTPWPEVPGAIRVLSADLISAYAVNQFAANDVYRGKVVETWGKVVRVYVDEAGLTAVEVSPSGMGGGYTLRCRVQPGEVGEATALVQGQPIFVVGLCEGVFRNGTGGYDIVLIDSVLLP